MDNSIPQNTLAATVSSQSQRRPAIFAFLMAGLFMGALDNQIVATALPTIVREFGHVERFGWLGSIYLLASSAVMPIYGKLGDLFGRKHVVIVAIAVFSLGSGVCALAPSMDMLIAARALQGLGGGGIMASVFALTADLYEVRERARYQSYSSLVLMIASAVGPVLGGLMSDLSGWRSIFLVNLPIGAVVVVGIGFLLPYRRPERVPAIDYLGGTLLACVITCLVLWADGLQLFGFTSLQNLAVIVLGLGLTIVWITAEKRAAEPIVPLSLFGKSTVNLLLIISAMSGAVGIGLAAYIAFYLQAAVRLSPALSGLFFIPLTVGIVAGSLAAGRIVSRTGRYKPFLLLSATSSVIVLTALAMVPASTSLWLIGALLLFNGLGIGVGQQMPLLGVQNAVDRRDIGVATSAVSLTRMGGASVAISVFGAILASATSLPQRTADAAANYGQAFQLLFLAAAAIAFFALITATRLDNVELPKRAD